MTEAKKQTLIIVISRYNLQPSLITPFSKIIPTLSLLYPIQIYTSMNIKINANNSELYSALVKHLEEQEGQCDISETLKTVLKDIEKEKKQKSFRVCIVGNQNIDWHVVMNFKRYSIIIDTISSNQQLFQISYVTGGINKNVSGSQMLKTFLINFGIKSKTRKMFKPEGKREVQFSLKCTCCSEYLKGDFRACSVCLSAYGHKDKLKVDNFECKTCGYNNKFNKTDH